MNPSDSERPEAPEQEDETRVVAALLDGQREFLGFLVRRLGDRALAEDILQEAFVRSLGKVADLREADSARAWFYRVLRNAIVDQARQRGSASARLARFAAELAAEPEDDETSSAVCQCVKRVAVALKPEYAQAVQSVEVEGMSMKDFAASVGISSNNAAVRVFRAREALKKGLLRACGACAKHGCLDCSCGQHGAGSAP
jgi:RNA polymerase sigma factor (sigma-70 family)